MEIKPKFGIDALVFGMKTNDVQKIWGNPDIIFKDEDENTIFIYHKKYCRLTFYHEEADKLSLILCSNPALRYKNNEIIFQTETNILSTFSEIKNWEKEEEDISTIYFNEENWLYLQLEFKKVLKIEMGVVAKNIDEFDWKY